MNTYLVVEDFGPNGVALKNDDKVIARGQLTVKESIGENIPEGTPVRLSLEFVGKSSEIAID